MPVLAVVLSVWTVWRWAGFVAGLARVRRFQGLQRREARRSVVGRGAVNVFWSIATFYVWAVVGELQPTETFVGLIAAVVMISLSVWVLTGFMQPAERTPETLDIFRLRPARPRHHDP